MKLGVHPDKIPVHVAYQNDGGQGGGVMAPPDYGPEDFSGPRGPADYSALSQCRNIQGRDPSPKFVTIIKNIEFLLKKNKALSHKKLKN